MIDERITEHLKLLCKYLGYLQTLAQKPKTELLNDMALRGASERYLQLAIESCINIGGRILAQQVETSELTAPENYADIFVKLGKLGAFPEDFVLRLVNMAKFRNKLVHGYWEISPERLYDILTGSLNDLQVFKSSISTFLNKKNAN
jgi:uncharacterized protein YutE (UPF0331/DUF86 family)